MYPKRNQVAIQGRENLTYYAFNDRLIAKPFCKTCGVNPVAEWTDVSQEHLDSIPEESRKFREANLGLFPVNVRTFDDFSLDGLKVTDYAGAHGKPYENP